MNYYIDFDNTLYNTPLLKNKMLQSVSNDISVKRNIDRKELFSECNLMFNRENIYDIYKLAEFFSNKYEVDSSDIINNLNKVILDGKENLFNDTIPFLKKLKKEGHKIYMLTYCKESLQFQSLKISGSQIANYFDGLYITSIPKYELDINYIEGIFIDDNPKDLNGLYLRNPKKLIRIRRKENKYSVYDLNINISEYNNFEEL